MKKILVAMSGGVDSSVTAKLLKEQGYECVGCTMKLYNPDELLPSEDKQLPDTDSELPISTDDTADAKSVAANLGMGHHILDYTEEFRERVINDFVHSYEIGRTPNPCIMCNKYLKFGKLLEQAKALGCDGIATGHYAQITFENGLYRLKKAADLSKDQSYVLYTLNQEQLSRIIFPLGGLSKSEARQIAEDEQFVNAKKHDSQDICFVPDGDYAGMIERYTKKLFKAGDFVDKDGNVLGRHKGIIHYTIGQRKGLGIAAENRLYVIKIDVPNNLVVLGDNEDLFDRTVNISNFHWIAGDNIPNEIKCKAKIRYRMIEQSATVYYHGKGHASIVFDEPQRAATPGQTAVLYDGDYVLGGGIID